MDKCIYCEREIKGEYFDGVSGKICVDCIKKMYIYHALKSMGFIKTICTEREVKP